MFWVPIIMNGVNWLPIFEYFAILDLKAAYDRVPRDKLARVLRERLPPNLVRQVLPFLKTGWAKCVGNSSSNLAEQTRGVPQGSPLSPTLFNIFMDVLAEKIEPNDSNDADSAIILFADDGQLRSKYRLSLQRGLDQAHKWAMHSDMTWNVRKCSTIQPTEDDSAFNMGHEPLKVGAGETYLGVTITRDGLTDALLKHRVKCARARLEMLKRIGLNAKGFGPKISRSMYLTFVMPMIEYCSHLVRIESSTMQEVLALEKAFFNAATGIYKAPLPWFRKLFKLEDFPARRI